MMRVHDLVLGYGEKPLNPAVSFSVAAGECVLVCGANGCGKSTLLKVLSDLEKPLGGLVDCPDAVYVPTRIPKVEGFTVLDFISSATHGCASSICVSALDLVAMGNFSQRDLSSLSDGEFQRVCVAAALASLEAKKGSVLLLDEPTAFLDVEGKSSLIRTIAKLAHGKGFTVLFSSHDIHFALPYADRVLAFGHQGSGLFLSGTDDESKVQALEKAFVYRIFAEWQTNYFSSTDTL